MTRSKASSEKKFEIQILNRSRFELWDRFVNEAPGGTLFHSTRWASIIQPIFARDFRILVLFKQQELQAGFLFWPAKTLGFSMITRAPLTPYQGFLFKASKKERSSGSIAQIQEWSSLLIAHLKEEFDYIDLVTVSEQQDIRPYIWQEFSAQPKFTYTFPLLPFDQLEKQFSQSLRRKIKNRSAGLEVEETQETDKLLQFVLDSYRYHGLEPSVPEKNLKKVFSALAAEDWAHVFYLKKDGVERAALLLLEDNRNVFALFAGVDTEARKEFYTEYLYTQCMKDSRFSGKKFDFLGANTKDFEQFKRSFGGDLQVYFELNYTRGKVLSSLSKLRKKQTMLKRRMGRNA